MPSPSPDFAVLARAMDIQLMVMLLDCYQGLLCQIVGSNLLSASVFCVQQPVAKEFIRFQDCGGERALLHLWRDMEQQFMSFTGMVFL